VQNIQPECIPTNSLLLNIQPGMFACNPARHLTLLLLLLLFALLSKLGMQPCIFANLHPCSIAFLQLVFQVPLLLMQALVAALSRPPAAALPALLAAPAQLP
jgi:hypothetical protein